MRREDVQSIYSKPNKTKKKWFWFIGVVCALIVIIFAASWVKQVHEQRLLNEYPIKGVSLNQSDGYIDFEALKSGGISFVYLRATQGAAYSDDSFDSNFERSQGSQLPIGVYHVFSFSTSPKAQFKNFVEQVRMNTGSLPIAIQLAYYGKYKKNTLRWKKVSANVEQLIKLLFKYYHRPLIINASDQIFSKLKLAPKYNREYWAADERLSSPANYATFLQVSQNQRIRLNKQTTTLPVSVFNGGQSKWNQYITKLVTN